MAKELFNHQLLGSTLAAFPFFRYLTGRVRGSSSSYLTPAPCFPVLQISVEFEPALPGSMPVPRSTMLPSVCIVSRNKLLDGTND